MTETQQNYGEGDIVEVRFYDLVCISSWTDIDKAKGDKPSQCKTQGHLLEETSEYLIISTAVSDDEDCHYWILPRGCVISIRKIEEAEVADFKENK